MLVTFFIYKIIQTEIHYLYHKNILYHSKTYKLPFNYDIEEI